MVLELLDALLASGLGQLGRVQDLADAAALADIPTHFLAHDSYLLAALMAFRAADVPSCTQVTTSLGRRTVPAPMMAWLPMTNP